MQALEITPVGLVHSPVTDASTVENWGRVTSEIHVADHLVPGLQGMEDWSHLIVIFLMHEIQFDAAQHLVRRPRDRDDMPALGIFAQAFASPPQSPWDYGSALGWGRGQGCQSAGVGCD